MAKGRNPADSQRQLRVGELVRHALVDVFAREGPRDPAFAGVHVTVSEVRMSPDLRHATCFVMPLGGGEQTEVLKALERSSGWLSGQVARRIKLKFAARLRFQLDRSFEEADRIGRLLRRPDVAQDLAEPDEGKREDGDGA